MITIISGESYQAYTHIQKLVKKFTDQTYEYYSFDGTAGEKSWEQRLIQLLSMQSLFQKKKVVVLALPSRKEIEDVLPLVQPVIGESEIIIHQKDGKKFTSRKTAYTLLHFDFPSGQALTKFIVDEFKKRNISNAQTLASLLGSQTKQLPNLFFLVNEIEKLSLAPQYANDLRVLKNPSNPFALTDAIAKKQTEQALIFLEEELRKGVQALDILGRILWQLRILILVHALNQGATLSLALHPFVIQKARMALGQFSLPELRTIYSDAISLYDEILFSGLPSGVLLFRFFVKP